MSWSKWIKPLIIIKSIWRSVRCRVSHRHLHARSRCVCVEKERKGRLQHQFLLHPRTSLRCGGMCQSGAIVRMGGGPIDHRSRCSDQLVFSTRKRCLVFYSMKGRRQNSMQFGDDITDIEQFYYEAKQLGRKVTLPFTVPILYSIYADPNTIQKLNILRILFTPKIQRSSGCLGQRDPTVRWSALRGYHSNGSSHWVDTLRKDGTRGRGAGDRYSRWVR